MALLRKIILFIFILMIKKNDAINYIKDNQSVKDSKKLDNKGA